MGRLNLAQRIVAVIGLAAALLIFGEWAMTWGSRPLTYSGWTGYVPLSNATYAQTMGGLHLWERMLIWLALIATWAITAAFVLRSSKHSGGKVS